MVRINAVLGTALLLPCYVLVAISPTAVDAGKVHASSSAMAAPSITTKTELHCGTVLGRGNANHPLPSRTATVTKRRQETDRLTSTPVVTVTAAKSTVSVTSTQNQVVTSTDSAVTDTLTVTTTPSTTQTLTITATTTTSVDGGTTTTTTTSTSVVPTPKSFTPIAWQFGGAPPATFTTTSSVGNPSFTVSRRNALPTVAADYAREKRGRKSNHRDNYGISAKKGDKNQLQAKEYVCVKDVVIVKKYTKVKVAPASTVTAAGATRTKSLTVTATSTVTVAPPHVSATVTSTAATVTSTASVTTTETATSTLFTTVTATETATSYAACASNNFLAKINGQAIRAVHQGDPRTSGGTAQFPADPETCCAQCQFDPHCSHFATKDGICTLFDSFACPATYDFAIFLPGDNQPGFTAGNGACGEGGI